jgi:tRNA(Arg) A34 adenosine deaminase TadA
MERAIQLALQGMESNLGGPFGALVVRDNIIVGEGNNLVTSSNDPTAHAEIVAIRNACKNLNTFKLTDSSIYCTCEPCPMCLGAIYWAGITNVYYAVDRLDAASAGFDDEYIYRELNANISERNIHFERIAEPGATDLFGLWNLKADKIRY